MAEWWQDPTQLAAIAAVLAALAGMLLFFWRWARAHDRLHAKLEGLPEDVADLRQKVTVLLLAEMARNKTLNDQLKAIAKPGSNPYEPTRRNSLLDRMRDGTITLEEARELQQYLREDAARLSALRDATASTAVSGLGMVTAYVYLLSGQACDFGRAFEWVFPQKFRPAGWKTPEPGAHEGPVRELGLAAPMDDRRLRYGPKSFLLCERHVSVIKEYDHRWREAYPGAQSALPVSERQD